MDNMDTVNPQNIESQKALTLPFVFGTEVLLELAALKLRIKSAIVGMEKGRYLIVRISDQDLIGSFRSELVKESPMALKFLHNNIIYGFSTEIIAVVSDPAKLFFVAYPKKIDTAVQQERARFECVLPATSMLGNDIIDMVIVDISREGCLCRIKVAGAKGEYLYRFLQVDKKVDIIVQFPGSEAKYDLTGRVRNISKDPDRIMLGVMFEGIPDETKARIDGYISLVAEAEKSRRGA